MNYKEGQKKFDKLQHYILSWKVDILMHIKLNLSYAISVMNQFMHFFYWKDICNNCISYSTSSQKSL